MKFCCSFDKATPETYKIAELWLRVFKVQVTHCQVSGDKRGKGASSDTWGPDGIQVTMLVNILGLSYSTC